MRQLFSPESEAVVSIHDQLAYLAQIHGPLPVRLLTQDQISTFLETAFWASLMSNEGRHARVRVAVAEPNDAPDSIAFAEPIEYDEIQIAKLAPAISRDGYLAISVSNERLRLWGVGNERATLRIETLAAEIVAPGAIRVDLGLWRPYMVLNGRSIAKVEAAGTDFSHHLQRVLRKSAFPNDLFERGMAWRECVALADLTRMVLTQGHGGMVLIVGSETGEWLRDLNPFPYQLAKPDTTIRDAIRAEMDELKNQGQLTQELEQAEIREDLKVRSLALLVPRRKGMSVGVRAAASLAGVDGAILMTQDLKLLGFGAKISIKADSTVAVHILKAGSGLQQAACCTLEDLGGTRHQSAARFVSSNMDAVAIVVSQDGHASAMQWDESSKSVTVLRNAEWLF